MSHKNKYALKVSPNDPKLFIPIYESTGHQASTPGVGIKDLDMGYTFKDSLVFDRIYTGRSAVQFVFSGQKYMEYWMFRTDFEGLVNNCILNKGIVSGTWGFIKKGANVGIVRVGP